MKKEEKIEKRNNRPRRLSESLKKINKNLTNKFGNINFVIYSNWPEIVGTFFVQHSEPKGIFTINITSSSNKNEDYEKILEVSVSPGAVVEFQHFQNKIIEKINSYLGYKAIHRIKINQNFKAKNIPISSKSTTNISDKILKKNKIEIKNTTQKINDKELEKSLINLGLSIEKNKEN